MHAADSVRQLAEYAECHGLQLAAYHDACRQLDAILGTEFAEARFAERVLTRLKCDGNDVRRAVSDAHAATLDGV
jgi:hypothetical protein